MSLQRLLVAVGVLGILLVGIRIGVHYEEAQTFMLRHPSLYEATPVVGGDAPGAVITSIPARSLGLSDSVHLLVHSIRPHLLVAWGEQRFLLYREDYSNTVVQNLAFLVPLPKPFNARAFGWITGLITLLLIADLATRRLGPEVGALTLAFTATHKLFIHQHAYGHSHVTLGVMLGTLAWWCYDRMASDGSRKWSIATATVCVVAVHAKLTTFAYLLSPLVAFVVAAPGVRMFRKAHLRALGMGLLGGVITVFAVLMSFPEVHSGKPKKMASSLMGVVSQPELLPVPLLHHGVFHYGLDFVTHILFTPFGWVWDVPRALLLLAGTVGLAQGLWRRDRPGWRVAAGLLLADMSLMAFSAVFYFGGISLDIQLFSIPLFHAAMAWGAVQWLPASFLGGARQWAAIIGVCGVLSIGTMFFVWPRGQLYEMHLAAQRNLIETLHEATQGPILTIDQQTMGTLTWLLPERQTIWSLQVWEWFRFHNPEFALGALRSKLEQTKPPVAVFPEFPLTEVEGVGRDFWPQVHAILEDQYGPPMKVQHFEENPALVYVAVPAETAAP